MKKICPVNEKTLEGQKILSAGKKGAVFLVRFRPFAQASAPHLSLR